LTLPEWISFLSIETPFPAFTPNGLDWHQDWSVGVTENGFSYMRRSLEQGLQHLLDSPLAANLKDILSNPTTSEGKVLVQDAEVVRMISKMAHEQDMDTGPFVAEVLNNVVQTHQKKIALWQQLTQREQEVAALACRGMSNAGIAELLNISEETVKTHMKNILHSFQVKGRGILKWMLQDWYFNNPQAPWEP
jgi:DNA-binding CsgD family transcriptional regulator